MSSDTPANVPPSTIWRLVGWGAALALLLTPLVAMQFTSEVHWTAEDFLFGAVLIGIPGLLFEVAVRASANWAYRLGAALGLVTGFFICWSNLAVGVVREGMNVPNLMIFAVVLIAVAGSLIARLQAQGMAWAMGVTAAAQSAVGIAILSEDRFVLPFTLAMTASWLVASALFAKAANDIGR